MKLLLLSLALLIGAAHGKRLVFENRSGSTIWVGSLGNPGKALIKDGGWALGAGSKTTVDVADDWAGRVWGRTGCRFDSNGSGRCETGDCGKGLRCGGNGGEPPASLAEFTFNGHGGQDFYDVSLVDGFNIPVTITPTDKFGGGDKYRCRSATCPVNINSYCKRELKQEVGGRVVGCKSACLAFNSDLYCCRGAHNRPETCRSTSWPQDYAGFFKGHCPDAYSYAYDDHKSTFTCDRTGYKIVLG